MSDIRVLLSESVWRFGKERELGSLVDKVEVKVERSHLRELADVFELSQ